MMEIKSTVIMQDVKVRQKKFPHHKNLAEELDMK
jgi:hypothetical protein